MIQTQRGPVILTGTMGVVVPTECQNPCRSELAGLLYLLLHLKYLCHKGNITEREVTLYCDGLSRMQSIEKICQYT